MVSSGNLGTVFATIRDANGNTVTSSLAVVTVTITGPNGYSQQVVANAVDGIALFDLSALNLTAPGNYTVTTSSPGLTGTNSIVTVTAVTTSVTLAASLNTAESGVSVTFTATISPNPTGSPLGTVYFCDAGSGPMVIGSTHSQVAESRRGRAIYCWVGAAVRRHSCGSGTVLGSATPDATGAATFATGSLIVGTHNITALYSGNASFGPAKQTAKATEDISLRIADIQADAKSAVEAIKAISGIIGRVNAISATIATAVEEQSATTSEMSRDVSEAAKGSAQVSKNITGVAQAAQNTSSGATESHKAARSLAQMSTDLRELVGQFKVDSNDYKNRPSA
ncbi:MAG: Ig-like domain repeat protein [Candidatus Acidiferrum sp.]